MNEINIRIEGIRSDRVHGASELAHAALGILQDAIQESEAESIPAFMIEIKAYAAELSAARPTMAAIANCIDRFIKSFRQLLQKEQSLADLKLSSRQAITAIITEIAHERNQTLQNGAALIGEHSVVMTCSYSSTVIAVFKTAAAQGKTFRVLALASDDSCYAQMTIDRLGESGIPGEVIPEGKLPEVLPLVTLILTGADAIMADGSLINGSPSLVLAQSAHDRKPPLPFYAVCEPMKFTPSIPPALEPGFDLVPSVFLTGIISVKR